MIPLSNPDITEIEIKLVTDVLRTPVLALGPKLNEFEDKFAGYIGKKYAVAVNSGTSGLHALIRSANIAEGDEVITSPFSFVATSNCILFEKAKPVFVDIEPLTLNIDPGKIENAITAKTKAIIVVDIFGYPADWDKINAIARKHNLEVIEDSCEAVGAEYKGVKCGNFGAAAVFAFYPNKQMTTGEGGMIVTDNLEIANYCRSVANQGRESRDGKWLEHVRLGYNYRMSDINAALGLAQLSRIDEILDKRNRVADAYSDYLGNLSDIVLPHADPEVKRSWFVYVVKLAGGFSREDRDLIIRLMGQKGVQCGNYFQCIHLQPFYKESFKYQEGIFPVAEAASDRTIALPFYNNLEKKDIEYVAASLREAITEAKNKR